MTRLALLLAAVVLCGCETPGTTTGRMERHYDEVISELSSENSALTDRLDRAYDRYEELLYVRMKDDCGGGTFRPDEDFPAPPTEDGEHSVLKEPPCDP